MILREGVETVLILSAVSLNTTELLNFLGTLIGIGLAVAFGVMFVRGTVKVNLQKFFKVTTVILFFVAFQLVISGPARTFRKRRAALEQARDGDDWPHRAQ